METTNRQLLTVISRWDLRLRFTQLAIWLPRGLAAGLAVGLIVSMISRLRPWLQSQQILVVALVAAAVGIVVAGLVVLLKPRSAMDKARYFDKLFGLKERSSTALELTNGLIKAPAYFAALQAQDAIAQAKSVNARGYLTVRWRSNELVSVLALAVVLLISVVLVNPQNNVLAQQRNLGIAISQQVQRLEKVQQSIDNNTALTQTDRAELKRIAQDAINQLQQPEVTQPEAVAALTRVEQDFNSSRTQLTAQQLAAAKNAAQALNQTKSTQDAAQALASGNLNNTASQLQDLAQKVGNGQMTSQQLGDMANSLGQAADSLTMMNAAAADALKRAAEAMKNGNTAEAQKDLNDAAKALQQQQQNNNSTPPSQAAQKGAQQASLGKSALAALSSSGSNSGNSQNAKQQNQQQASQGQNQSNPDNQTGQGSDQSGVKNGNSQDNQDGNSLQAADSPNQGPSDSLNSTDPNLASSDNTVGGSTDKALKGAGESQSPGSSQKPGDVGDGGAGAGQGKGAAGTDITKGNLSPVNGAYDPTNGHGTGNVVPYERVYAPTFAGGNGGDPLNLKNGANPSNGGDPVTSGDFSQNPNGDSTVPLNSVSAEAAGEADLAIDAGHVPGTLR